MSKALLFLRTVRYLKIIQIFYFIYYRILPRRQRNLHLTFEPVRRADLSPGSFLQTSALVSGEFQFLNKREAVDPEILDWRGRGKSKLWSYNLHYFDYLQSADCPAKLGAALIESWIEKNPVGTGVGWEPYPTSLRIVNWIKFFLANSDCKEDWLRSLATQTLWLERNIEYHILANHLLKNAKALLFAGIYFEGRQADRWFKKGEMIFRAQIREQFLPDGGHFERSLMYHAICAEDLLDVSNLLQGNAGLRSSRLLRDTDKKALAALRFLEDLCYPDDEIPLFNDSAFQIAAPSKRLCEYGTRVAGFGSEKLRSTRIISKPDSGYYGWRSGEDMLVFDCGPIGPDYQPGHGHCDALSYELVIDGRRTIVDTGVDDYGSASSRDYVRGTAAHNTIRIDNTEQSEIWGAFRVARRSFPIGGGVERLDGGGIRVFGAHDGYKRLKGGGAVHRRQIINSESGVWLIEDEIVGKGEHFVESFIHVHPDFKIERDGIFISLCDRNDKYFAKIVLPTGWEISLNTGCYYPQFGLELPNTMITISSTIKLPAKLHYRIEKA